MGDHYHDPEYLAAREKLTEALQEYEKATGDGAIILGGTVVYEVSKFDDDGHQIYWMKHVILDPSSLVHAVGLLSTARDRLSAYINQGDD